jgi:hypothetical protein
MMRRLPLALLLISPVAAEAPAEVPSLGWFHGEWTGEGSVFNRPTKMTLSVEPALLDSATVLIYRVDADATASQPAFRFEGRSTYRVGKDGKVIGYWADSQGNFHPLAGRLKGTALNVTWGEARTEIGQSSYVLGPDGTLSVSDSGLGNGTLRVFANGKYRRK